MKIFASDMHGQLIIITTRYMASYNTDELKKTVVLSRSYWHGLEVLALSFEVFLVISVRLVSRSFHLLLELEGNMKVYCINRRGFC